MDTKLIIEALRNCSVETVADAEQIIALRSQYPYSQALQVLAARLSQDHQLATQQADLQKAAIYSSDRSVLKEVMTYGFGVDNDKDAEESAKEVEAIEKAAMNFDVAELVLKDLKKLNELKHNFEMLFDDHTTVSLPVVKEKEVAKEKESKEENAGVESTKSRKQKIVELAKSVNKPDKATTPPATRRKRKESPPDKLIEELTSKEELEIENEKQKEQIEIIDQFIKTAPSISNAREKDKVIPPPSDITFIKTGEFNENVVSETLVNILIKQGKKERAIEVLKKLIWKYPQKKAYFASQIEDLKK